MSSDSTSPDFNKLAQNKWLEPWSQVEDGSGLEEELKREVSRLHPLYGIEAKAIGQGREDDFLFALADGRCALVHLTWKRESSAEWPWTVFFDDFETWRTESMLPDHEYFLREEQ